MRRRTARQAGSDERNEKVFEASYAANSMWAIYWPLISMLMGIGSYIIWIYGGYSVLHGVMTIGTLTAFNGYLMQFYAPFQNFSRVMDWTTRSMTAAERVFEVLDTEPDIRRREQAGSVPGDRGRGRVRAMSRSPTTRPSGCCDDFTLKVEPGEMIGLVGHSGAGKSTIINLLSRFYDVTEGSIKIDGVDIRKLQRRTTSAASSASCCRSRSCSPAPSGTTSPTRKPDATVEEIMRAAKAANCHDFILKFPMATIRRSASAGSGFRAASASASPSRAPSCTTRGS